MPPKAPDARKLFDRNRRFRGDGPLLEWPNAPRRDGTSSPHPNPLPARGARE